MKRTAAIVITFTLIAGACSSGKADTVSLPDQTETSERPPVDLEDIIITIDDVLSWNYSPGEWSVVAPGDGENVEGGKCVEQLAVFAAADFEDGAGVTGQFSKSESGPFLIAAVSRPDGELEDFYDNVAAAFDACDNVAGADGPRFEFPLEKFEDLLGKIVSSTMTLDGPPLVALEVATTRVLDVMIMTFAASVDDGLDGALPQIMIRIMTERADPLAEPIPLGVPVVTD